MIYLSGAVRREVLNMESIGVILTPNMGNRPDLSATRWAADNGCFSRGEAFSLSAYIEWLQGRACFLPTCLFAVAPDVVADAPATWARSRPVLPLLRELGYPAAYVAQDGLEDMEVEWGAFDALFIGGSTQWKLSPHAQSAVHEAKRRSKWVHMGRVNSFKRLLAAAQMGCDSVDGTYLAFGPDRNLPRLRSWLRRLELQPSLWADTASDTASNGAEKR